MKGDFTTFHALLSLLQKFTHVIFAKQGWWAVLLSQDQNKDAINDAIRNHPIEAVGQRLRAAMTAMKVIETSTIEGSVLA